jgi:tRNA A-37 threonylcarbamoyl transferase component Bud32
VTVGSPISSLSPGDRLGRYQIVSLIGTGGMGAVYRARDPELHRDVALKVLLRRALIGAEDVARFTREARAAGSLNHPNIVAVHDVGIALGVPYVVTELLDGETLRERLDRGPLPFHKAVEYAVGIADALGAAHARGIWHRDVKPANVFITTDGRVKLLDFGIAKLAHRHLGAESSDPTDELTDPHDVLGTAGYMAPEQVLAQPVDHRADIFALGAVLYEMLTRSRAFKRGSAVETMTAVLQEEPADPVTLNPALTPMAVAIVRRCLEKNKEERFQSARDLAFDLQQLRDHSTSTRAPARGAVVGRRRTTGVAVIAALVLAAAAGASWLLARPPASPSFEQLTFRRARISAARFVSDDRSVVYSESPAGNALQLWRLNLGEPPPTRPLDLPDGTDVLSADARELTLLVDRRYVLGERFVGTLATAPFAGGAPRKLEENIEDADWDPAEREMVIVRSSGGIGGRSWLEYPAGTRVHESAGSIRFPRVSPDRRHIAFIEYGSASGESGQVSLATIEGAGAVRVLAEGWRSIRGLAWSPDGSEIWFTAGDSRSNRALRAVTVDGRQRVVLAAPGSLTLWDVARDGRLLLSRDDERRALIGVTPGSTIERDLSLFDDSGLADISDDGKRALFSDRTGMFIRDLDALPTHLGRTDAYADDLSPDGQKVLATSRDTGELVILPTGPGSDQKIPAHNIVRYRGARFFPDGRRIFFTGLEAGRNLRTYVQDLGGGAPVPLTREHVWALAISPDGRYAAAIGDNEPGISLWSIDGSAPARMLAGSLPGDRPAAFTADGSALWAFRRGEVPTPIVRLDLATGRRDVWKIIAPADSAGVYSVTEFAITPDGRAYYYSYLRSLSQLFLVTGVR